MTYLLARTIMEGQNADSENLETVFARSHKEMAAAEQFLVDWDGEYQAAGVETEFPTDWVDCFTQTQTIKPARRRPVVNRQTRPELHELPMLAMPVPQGGNEARPVQLSMAEFLAQETERQKALIGRNPAFGIPKRRRNRKTETPRLL